VCAEPERRGVDRRDGTLFGRRAVRRDGKAVHTVADRRERLQLIEVHAHPILTAGDLARIRTRTRDRTHTYGVAWRARLGRDHDDVADVKPRVIGESRVDRDRPVLLPSRLRAERMRRRGDDRREKDESVFAHAGERLRGERPSRGARSRCQSARGCATQAFVSLNEWRVCSSVYDGLANDPIPFFTRNAARPSSRTPVTIAPTHM